MYKVKISFYGRGNAPRGLKGFGDRFSAENYAYDVMDRYENQHLVGAAQDKRIKNVDVQDRDGNSLTTFSYPESYDFVYYLHGKPLNGE